MYVCEREHVHSVKPVRGFLMTMVLFGCFCVHVYGQSTPDLRDLLVISIMSLQAILIELRSTGGGRALGSTSAGLETFIQNRRKKQSQIYYKHNGLRCPKAERSRKTSCLPSTALSETSVARSAFFSSPLCFSDDPRQDKRRGD